MLRITIYCTIVNGERFKAAANGHFTGEGLSGEDILMCPRW